MPRTRPPYPPEFRAQLVALHRAGRTPAELAKEFEPSEATIHPWIAQAAAGRQLARLAGLPPFERLVLLLQVFQRLAAGAERGEVTTLAAGPLAGVQDPHTERQRLARVSRLVMQHYARRIPLAEAAAAANLSEAAFCRFFTRMTARTFTAFVNQYRVHGAQRLLLADGSVTEAAFACGFEDVACFTRVFRRVAGDAARAVPNVPMRRQSARRHTSSTSAFSKRWSATMHRRSGGRISGRVPRQSPADPASCTRPSQHRLRAENALGAISNA